MDEDEAALLAELRAISATSASAGRFAEDEEDEAESTKFSTETNTLSSSERFDSNRTHASHQSKMSKMAERSWKRGRNRLSGGGNSLSNDQFSGNSHYEDEDNVDLIDPIEKARIQSGLISYDSDNGSFDSYDRPGPKSTTTESSKVAQFKSKNQQAGSVPPWRRSKKDIANQKSDKMATNVLATSGFAVGGGFKSSLPSTYKGDRGGTAEDADLLAELRAISSTSASASRFDNSDDTEQEDIIDNSNDCGSNAQNFFGTENLHNNKNSNASASKQSTPVPPWKRGKKAAVKKCEVTIDVMTHLPSQKTGQENAVNGFKSSTASTFKGELGGAAEDAELLASLRSISSNSASADRFKGTDPADNDPFFEGETPSQELLLNDATNQSVQKQPCSTRNKAEAIPPWKRGNKNVAKKSEPTFDIEVSAPTRPTTSSGNNPTEQNFGGFKPSIPSTFKGERGGSAEDNDLLAELRAISANSVSADRFADSAEDNNEMNNYDDSLLGDVPNVGERQQPSKQKDESASLPPWKRGKTKFNEKPEEKIDKVITAPTRSQPASPEKPMELNYGGFKASVPSTFSGERGGAAEDADLLAELRAISASSTSANRFVETDQEDLESDFDNVPDADDVTGIMEHQLFPKNKKQTESLPPWKRGKQNVAKSQDEIDVVVAAPPHPRRISPDPEPQESMDHNLGDLKTSIPSTFKGERGGAAEDADLLAELRAISAGSASANRFSEPEDGGKDINIDPEEVSRVVDDDAKNSSSLPPWKKNKKNTLKTQDTIDVLVAAPPRPHLKSQPVKQTFGGFSSSQPSLYKGERGGVAEDADLLAELRAISTNSASVNRFAQADQEEGELGDNDAIQVRDEKSFRELGQKPKPRNESASLPPWKRNKKSINKAEETVDVIVAAPSQHNPKTQPFEQAFGGFKSSQPSTFKGERGGAAEDADLLAELRAISTNSKSVDRFAETDQEEVELGDNDAILTRDLNSIADADQPPKPRVESAPLPPWKRNKKSVKKAEETIDVVVAASARPGPKSEPVEQSFGGFKSSRPSTFKGERGGAAEDADLLAELRAISTNSKSVDRFAEADDYEEEELRYDDTTLTGNANVNGLVEADKAVKPRVESAPLPPWKRNKKSVKKAEETIDVVVAAPPQASSKSEPVEQSFGGFKSSQPSTFKGERGGAAEDADLLAELRAISTNSKSVDRFAEADDYEEEELRYDDTTLTGNENGLVEPRVESAPLPPWKRNKKSVKKAEETIDVVVAASARAGPKSEPVEQSFGGFKSSQPSTFKGERGGAAEDADLLAELRAISTNSKSVDRFAEADDYEEEELRYDDTTLTGNSNVNGLVEGDKAVKPRVESAPLPPWKRNKKSVKKAEETIDVVVAASARPESKSEPVEQSFGGFKSSQPSTFKGERGGAAEDADLLAELIAISTNSKSVDRFAEADDYEEEELRYDDTTLTGNENGLVEADKAVKPRVESAPLPPWKRNKKSVKKAEETIDVVVAAPPQASSKSEPVEQSFGGFQSSVVSTFKGERGGAAEDADLLAELRAISTNSKSVDRFAEADDDDEEELRYDDTTPTGNPDANGLVEADKAVKPRVESAPLPPWKRNKKSVKKAEETIDVVVAAPPRPGPKSEPVEQSFGGFKSSQPSTFKGERGGAAEDADLLAELRAISTNSKSVDRFAEADDYEEEELRYDDTTLTGNANVNGLVEADKAVKPRVESAPLPPWKRNKKSVKKAEETIDVVVAAPPQASSKSEPVEQSFGGFKSWQPSTFKGERGGAAEDADLLAELRAISTNSKSVDRFAEADDYEEEELRYDNTTRSGNANGLVEGDKAVKPRVESAPLPPWKRNKKSVKKAEETIDVVVAASARAGPKSEPVEQSFGGFKSSQPSTFKGERGGAAEDVDLLAELRAISTNSKSVDRFAEADDYEEEELRYDDTTLTGNANGLVEGDKAVKPRVESAPLPPWKRNKKSVKKAEETIDVVVAAPPQASSKSEPVEQSFGGFQSSVVSTFKGERGGAAEDADLLAELRAISTNSSSVNRFTEADEEETDLGDGGPVRAGDGRIVRERGQNLKSNPKPRNESASLPPWKRGKKNPKDSEETIDVIVAAPPRPTAESQPVMRTSRGFNSSLPSTFKGERGGAAEDADLLAELRAISTNSTSVDRFADVDQDDEDAVSKGNFPSSNDFPVGPSRQVIAKANFGREKVANNPVSRPEETPNPVVFETAGATGQSTIPAMSSTVDSDILITIEDLPSSLADKKWKVRKMSYEFLCKLITKTLVMRGEHSGALQSNSVIDDLDSSIVSMVADSNVVALDSALQCANLYAEHCYLAGSPELAREIVSSLARGNALAASRPSTAKLTSSLILKLMEVGHQGVQSVHSVVEVLLDQGLKAKKPKVVITSTAIILETANAFGASCLPLALVSSSAPKMLTHSNAQVRENGMKIVAEICRALGSKNNLKAVLDVMKKAQISQLDSMLEKQPGPTPIGVGFRNQTDEADSSPEAALAALDAGNKELEAQRFAARPEVNIFEELERSDYSERIKLPKWSEKVAALDKLLECGGEQPYKLKQPSPSIKYGPLVSDMKKLLSHTHFAVCGKTMRVLSMLAEGVGEKMFPYLRPLLITLAELSKDKKLTKSAASCLDSLFGNILSFDHLLDQDDALPEALNENKAKNALGRSSALQFLGRCVTRREAAGVRGNLLPRHAHGVANLCLLKLEDSDASVRKAAMEVLQILQSIDDEEISSIVSEIIQDLKKSNPRAYKSLQRSATSGGKTGKSVSRQGQQRKNSQKQENRPNEESHPKEDQRQEESSRKTTATSCAPSKKNAGKTTDRDAAVVNEDIPDIESALDFLAGLEIPYWKAPADENGVLDGLRSSKWSFRQNAIKSLITFINSGGLSRSSASLNDKSGFILLVVKVHTKEFKETNINVAKAAIELFLELFDSHQAAEQIFLVKWAVKDAVKLAVDKIADKKLSGLAKSMLTGLCVVCHPQSVTLDVSLQAGKVKSPVAHEEILKWFESFCEDFGAALLGNCINDLLPWLLQETKSKNIKVKKAALSVTGTLHVQLGPVFKALFLSQCKDKMQSEELEKVFQSNPFDPSAASAERGISSIAIKSNVNGEQEGDSNVVSASPNISLRIPRTDLISYLPADCARNMGSKDGKTAWKLRKEAIDQVDSALKKSNGLLDTSTPKLKELFDLLRALRDRLSDSQSNLKPLAARVIGSLIASVDKNSQAKFGKIVYAPLINAAINDIKKPMREAALESLRSGTTSAELEGGGLNENTLEALVTALVAELNDTAMKAGGLPAVLEFVLSIASRFPNLDIIMSSHGQALGAKFATAIVNCLTSSRSETRNLAEKLLTTCVKSEVISLDQIKGCTERMKPAKQRTVAPIIAKFSKSMQSEEIVNEKEKTLSNAVNEHASALKSSGSMPTRRGSTPPKQGKRASILTREQFRESGSAIPRGTRKANASTDEPLRESALAKARPEAPQHPLIASEKPRSAVRSFNWPEFPEELTGSLLFGQLKRAWSPLLPTSSIACFFPNGGIRKQDDGKAGCDLLARAIVVEREGNGVAIEEQLEFVFKWIAYVLYSKEHTVGLQVLLALLNDLFAYLRDIKYELSDSEAFVLVPILLEKGSNSKGRFRELFDDLLTLIKSEELLPPKRLGSVVCVPVMERSTHGKGRAVACQECAVCVEKVGLSGIGKKGVLVCAKSLSEETLAENKNLSLELMVLVLSRMNGDVQRLVRICGANLSDKALRMVEERWRKRGASGSLPGPVGGGAGDEKLSRRSGIPSSIPSAIPSPNKARSRHTAIPAGMQRGSGNAQSMLRDELPALVLKVETEERSHATDVSQLSGSVSTNNGPFNLTLNVGDSDQSLEKTGTRTTSTSPASKSISPSSIPSTHTNETTETFGAAASLRARLLRIREKSKIPESAIATKQVIPSPRDVAPVDDMNASIRSEGLGGSARSMESISERRREYDQTSGVENLERGEADQVSATQNPDQHKEYEQGIAFVNTVLGKNIPIMEDDPDLMACIEVLKKFHAALSKQPNAVVDLGVQELILLRHRIADSVNTTIRYLTRLTRFAFECEHSSRNAGISVPLLSVCLATLMALFRDQELATSVSAEDLTLLIKETGTALLDPRLSVSSQAQSGNSLDDATSSQVVRAINKLAVQAATGGARHSSLQALMTLQQQLCFEPSTLNTRLSRVVTKLFSRVVKAEESSPDPFKSDLVNIGALLNSLDYLFAACNDAESRLPTNDMDSVEVCRNMAKTLVSSLIRAMGDVHSVRDHMQVVGIDLKSSALAMTLSLFAPEEIHQTQDELNTRQEAPPPKPESDHSDASAKNSQPVTPTKNAPAKDVAVLVSALGSAQFGEERDAALAALRRYTSVHGDDDLSAHLEQVSSPFRAFIVDQLSESLPKKATDEVGASSMSERLRSLRSRLDATEVAVQTAVKPSASEIGGRVTSGLPQKSPSRIPKPGTSKIPSYANSGGDQVVHESDQDPELGAGDYPESEPESETQSVATAPSLRERLAAAQENRKTNFGFGQSAGGRAAALRARLEAVKQQSKT